MAIPGYAGSILFVDLTSERTREESLDPELARTLIGGCGINNKLAYDLMPQGIDPLSPQNLIIIGAGPFADTLVPGAAKILVTTRFPLNGTFATAAFRFAGVWPENWYDNKLKDGLPPTTAWSDDLYQWVHRWDVCAGIRQALECPTLPGHGVYTLSAADTRCPEPTMELLWKFRPDLAAAVNPSLVGREPLLSIAKAHRAFGYSPQHRFPE